MYSHKADLSSFDSVFLCLTENLLLNEELCYD